MADGIATCKNCGVRVMQMLFPSGQWVWFHAAETGPVYLRIECALFAEPEETGASNG